MGAFNNQLDSRCYPVTRRIQESAAYATVSARQSRHLANTFEVAAIELSNLRSHLAKALELHNSLSLAMPQPTIV